MTFIEQDKAGTWNTFVPFFKGMRKLCKHLNNPKDGLTFNVQMNVVPGYGLAIQYGLPYLASGTMSFFVTSMSFAVVLAFLSACYVAFCHAYHQAQIST